MILPVNLVKVIRNLLSIYFDYKSLLLTIKVYV